MGIARGYVEQQRGEKGKYASIENVLSLKHGLEPYHGGPIEATLSNSTYCSCHRTDGKTSLIEIVSVATMPSGIGREQREGFDRKRVSHPLVFPDNHPNFSLRGKAKGAEAILRESGLWPNNGW